MSYAEPLLAQNYQASWEEETDYKTRPTNIDRYIRLYAEPEFPWPQREVEVVHAPGHGRQPAYVNDEMRAEMKGTLPIEVVSGEILGAIFGLCVTTGTGPDWIHTYDLSNAMPKSFATQYAFLAGANVVQEFLGNRVTSALFKSTEDDEKLKCDIEYLSAKPTDGGATAETITKNADPPFMFKQGVLSSTALYSGPKARIHGFELPININCKSNYAGGTGDNYPYDILPGKADFGELKLTVGLEDDTEWNEVYDPAKVGTIYDWTYLFSRGTNDTLEFNGNAKLKPGNPKADEHDIRMDLTLVPISCTGILINTTQVWPFE